MLETTFWSHDIRSVRSRKNRQNMNEEKRHISVNQKLKETFNLTFDVPTVFIDPVLPIFGDDYDQSIMEENEVEAFEEYTRQLWDFAMNKEPFHCAGNCQAPQGYFGGQPWVTPNKVCRITSLRFGNSVTHLTAIQLLFISISNHTSTYNTI